MAAKVGPMATQRPRVVVVGSGRLGGALALSLAARRWPVRVLSRTEEGRRRAQALGLKPATPQDLAQARVALLCVPDKAVSEVAREQARTLGKGAALVHCAGALSLQALGAPRGRATGSFHPLCAVSDPRDSLAGHAVAISTRSRALKAVLQRMAKDLELSVLHVPEARRAAYHAGAVLSAGGAVALMATAVEAMEHAGVSADQALAALLPLMRSALRGMEARGLAGGLTGPVVRGDAPVVAAHLQALPEEVAPVYRLLSLQALRLAEPRLSPEARVALAKLLQVSPGRRRP
ncbi:Rossmann-like and DUF2520 domain-containing protein [Hyalangium rubrum]|uniref:DUF2520 domain-containing protein n=1 Tax=Hyalangium rubrum TaxID=3103134 RepID=A0ABU5H4T6_9BACT|nr:DUF2520 domain-containing protein [Hyalangium sp. s54d21]MDY7228127.1 DUF2520 domain-containing protein [Hyalangium sp. s54d21]